MLCDELLLRHAMLCGCLLSCDSGKAIYIPTLNTPEYDH